MVEHTLNAPVDRVWTMWSDPETIKQWWSPTDFTAPVIKNDFRIGGRYLFAMKDPKGEMFWSAGVYHEIVPQQKIVSSHYFADESGNAIPSPVPGEWPAEVQVMVEFSDAGGKTHVKVTETGIPLIMKFFAGMGWKQQFEKFDKLLPQ